VISEPLVLYIPSKILDFVLLLFGYPFIPSEMRALLTGCIAFVMYIQLGRFAIDYIKKILGMNADRGQRR
jgi:hypothetical protein